MNNMDILDTKYTFWKLINKYGIEIPIMQRDYAHGRLNERTAAIREELLDNLFNSFDVDANIDFDFVYGSIRDGVLLPLDGQQRLTTLFLLHWYIAMKEGKLTKDISRVLDKFTYSTRISSREFCHKLVYFDFDFDESHIISEVIKDSNWYFRSWDKDPTIKSMLIMIDSINTKFFNTEGIFEKLIRDIGENPPITFSFISLDDYSLTDDLYIKMNARGKILSDFENFKAKFLQYLKNKGFAYKHFEDSIDNKWTDLLWEYRSSDDTIDDAFIRFFMFVTEMIYTEDAEAQDMNSPYRKFDIKTLLQTYYQNEKVQRLYEMLDLWSSKDEIQRCMASIFSTKHEDGKTKLFAQDANLMDQCLKGESLSLADKVLLYMVMRRLVCYKQQGKIDNGLNDYARVIRNLLSRIRTLKGNFYQSDFRYGRHAIPFVQFIEKHLLYAENVYDVLPSLSAPAAIREDSLKDEIDKANLINKDSRNKKRIHRLEDLDMFEGSTHNVMGLLTNSKKDYTKTFEEIFSSENTVHVTRALLSIADYGIRLGGSALGDRVYFGTEGYWNTILTSKRDDNYPKIFSKLINQYNQMKAAKAQDKLLELIDMNLKKMNPETWRYYFVKYPRMLGNKNMIYAFENRDENNLKIHMMNGSTLNAYHIVPIYREVAFQLGYEKCYEDNCKKIGSEEGAIVLNCGVSVNLNDEGRWIISQNEESEEIEKGVDEVIETINEDEDFSDLDYVEQGVKACNLLYDKLKGINIE